MAVLKTKDIIKMDAKSRSEKLKDLKMELIKVKSSPSKNSGKTKEIKRAIARIFTINAKEKKSRQTLNK